MPVRATGGKDTMTPMTVVLRSGVAVTFDAANVAHLAEVGRLLHRRGHAEAFAVEEPPATEPVEVEEPTTRLDLHQHVRVDGEYVEIASPDTGPLRVYVGSYAFADGVAAAMRLALARWIDHANRAHVEVIG